MIIYAQYFRVRNHYLKVSTAPKRARVWEQTYSQTLSQNIIDIRDEIGFRSRSDGVRLGRMVFGVENSKVGTGKSKTIRYFEWITE